MAILLGDQGRIELRRSTDTSVDFLTGNIANADINIEKSRFGVTGGSFARGQILLSGDRVSIKRTDEGALGWIDGHSSLFGFTGYVHVDAAGGIYLYRSHLLAINGQMEGRVLLNNTSLPSQEGGVEHQFEIDASAYRLLGQVSSYELNTEREAVDVTSLSDDFRSSISGLVSGNGRLTAFFDYRRNGTDTGYYGVPSEGLELPMFVSQLVLRTGLGSTFHGKFYVVSEGSKHFMENDSKDDEIWYECDARISTAALDFTVSGAVEVTIEFITTGAILLQTQLDNTGNLLTAGNDNLQTGSNQDTGDGSLSVAS